VRNVHGTQILEFAPACNVAIVPLAISGEIPRRVRTTQRYFLPSAGWTSSRALKAAVGGRNFGVSVPEYIFRHFFSRLPRYFGAVESGVCFKIHKALAVQPCVSRTNVSEHEARSRGERKSRRRLPLGDLIEKYYDWGLAFAHVISNFTRWIVRRSCAWSSANTIRHKWRKFRKIKFCVYLQHFLMIFR